MPTIIPTLTYLDGNVLNAEDHNRNVYDTTPGRGIMSTANGALDTGNLSAGFKVRSEHIMPQTLVRTNQEFSLEPIDCFEQAFAANVDPKTYSYNTAPSRLWVPVPGCSMRFYLPRQATCLMRLGFFCHPFKISYRANNADPVDDVTFDCAVAIKIDGVLVGATKRPLPSTAKYKTTATSGSEGNIDDVADTDYSQRRTATWYDMHLLRPSLAAGVHDIQLVMYMESVDISREESTDSQVLTTTTGQVKLARQRFGFDKTKFFDASPRSQYGLQEKRNAHLIFQRATFGVRHARILAMT